MGSVNWTATPWNPVPQCTRHANVGVGAAEILTELICQRILSVGDGVGSGPGHGRAHRARRTLTLDVTSSLASDAGRW